MKLSSLKQSIVHRTLLYGPAKSGKSASVGKLAEHYNLLWFDLEDGVKVLLNPEIKLASSALDHVEVIKLPDTRDFPIAAETLYEVSKFKPFSFCEAHGKKACVHCIAAKAPFYDLDFNKIDNTWIIVIDSLTQLSNSVMAMIMKAAGMTGYDAKPGWDEFGKQGLWLDRFFSAFQNAPYNLIVISHERGIEQEDGKEKLTAVGGTRNFSRNLPRYFDHVVYTELKNKKHVMGSATTYAINVMTGSRTGAKTEGTTPDKPSMGLLEIYKEVRNYQVVGNKV